MGCLTALFRDIAVAVEEHEPFLAEHFGAASVLEVVAGLQVRGGLRVQCLGFRARSWSAPFVTLFEPHTWYAGNWGDPRPDPIP